MYSNLNFSNYKSSKCHSLGQTLFLGPMVNLRTEALHGIEDGIMCGQNLSSGPSSSMEQPRHLSSLWASVSSSVSITAMGLEDL